MIHNQDSTLNRLVSFEVRPCSQVPLDILDEALANIRPRTLHLNQPVAASRGNKDVSRDTLTHRLVEVLGVEPSLLEEA